MLNVPELVRWMANAHVEAVGVDKYQAGTPVQLCHDLCMAHLLTNR